EQIGTAPDDTFKGNLRRFQFQRKLSIRDFSDVGMSEGVIADLVAFGDFPLQQVGMLLRVDAHHEERCRRVFRLQDVEYRRSVLRIWAVVERQRYFAFRAAVSIDHPRHWNASKFRLDDHPSRGIKSYFASALLWLADIRDVQDFAETFVVETVTVSHRDQSRRRCSIQRLA